MYLLGLFVCSLINHSSKGGRELFEVHRYMYPTTKCYQRSLVKNGNLWHILRGLLNYFSSLFPADLLVFLLVVIKFRDWLLLCTPHLKFVCWKKIPWEQGWVFAFINRKFCCPLLRLMHLRNCDNLVCHITTHTLSCWRQLGTAPWFLLRLQFRSLDGSLFGRRRRSSPWSQRWLHQNLPRIHSS